MAKWDLFLRKVQRSLEGKEIEIIKDIVLNTVSERVKNKKKLYRSINFKLDD